MRYAGLVGTNYYLEQRPCEHCNRASDRLHIGKRSAGWKFSLRIYEDVPDGFSSPITSLDDWRPLLSSFANTIVDENGKVLSSLEMIKIITTPSWDKPLQSMIAYNGPHHVVREGGPTWDLCGYEFS